MDVAILVLSGADALMPQSKEHIVRTAARWPKLFCVSGTDPGGGS